MVNTIGEYVSGRIFLLTGNLNSGDAKARLAQLRRGIGKTPGELPELWGVFLQTLPEELVSKGNEPSYAEWAIYTSLTLLALHQQGHSEAMNSLGKENSLGCAARKLVHSDEEEERIRFKLSLAAQADDMAELAYRLKTLIRLLSTDNIPLDYVDLARDLFLFQSEKHTDKIRLKWGRDFYRNMQTNDKGEGEKSNEKNNLYVDIHVLQNVPPSCVNRDDTGSPKTAKYGGTVRARVSSQAWKHEMRKMFEKIFDEDEIGVRTKKAPWMIADEIKKMDGGIDDEKALKLATKALGNIGVKADKDDKTAVLLFFSLAQARALAKLTVEGCNDKKEYQSALKESPSIDMALFGRMVAADAGLNVDAAVQVAHAISTHTVHNEYDYFTAVDDLIREDESGAGHLGTVEFNSSTLYRYATVNAKELYKMLGDRTADAVKGFAEAFIKSMPTGKQNTFANRTVPDYIYITLRTDQPINLCGAFERPVSGKNSGYLEMSEKALKDYSEKVYRNYACEPEKSWTFEDGNFTQILLELEETVKEMLAESEGE